MINVLAAEGEYQVFHLRSGDKFWLLFSAVTALVAIGAGFVFARSVLAEDQGTPKMREIATQIQVGALAYLKRQFKTILLILVPLVVIVFLTATKTVKPSARWRSSPGRSYPD